MIKEKIGALGKLYVMALQFSLLLTIGHMCWAAWELEAHRAINSTRQERASGLEEKTGIRL